MMQRQRIGAAPKPPVPPPPPGEASKPGPTPVNNSSSGPAATPPPLVSSTAIVGPPRITMAPSLASTPEAPLPANNSALVVQNSNCTVPEAGKSEPLPPAIIKVMDNYIGSVVGNAVTIVLLYAPLLYNLVMGNIAETIALWNSKAVEVGLANNLVWLFYGVVRLEKDKTRDMIVGNSWAASSNLAYLLVIYAHRRQICRACCMFPFVMLCAMGALALFQLELTEEKNKLCGKIFGWGGNILLGGAHAIQLIDLYKATQQRQLLSALISVGPSFAFAIDQSITTFISHRDQIFIVISCGINIVCYLLEILLILKMHFIIKEESKKVLTRIQSSFIRRGRSSGDIEAGIGFEDMDENDEMFYNEARRTHPSSQGDIELTERTQDESGHAVEVEATIQHGSLAIELDQNTLPESDTTRDADDENVTDYESAPEDMVQEELIARLAAADDQIGIGDVDTQFNVITVGMVLIEDVIVDPAEIQTSIYVPYPWETEVESTVTGDIELTERSTRDESGHAVEVEAAIQDGSSAIELDQDTLPEYDTTPDAADPEDMVQEELPARLAAADTAEVQTNISVLHPWETEVESTLKDSDMAVQGVGRDDIPGGKNGSMRKRKKTTTLAELVGMGGGRPRKRAQNQAAPTRRVRTHMPSWMSFGCKE